MMRHSPKGNTNTRISFSILTLPKGATSNLLPAGKKFRTDGASDDHWLGKDHNGETGYQ
jgi:hypothetical protein